IAFFFANVNFLLFYWLLTYEHFMSCCWRVSFFFFFFFVFFFFFFFVFLFVFFFFFMCYF
ncbi:hypothetical protein FQZ98_28695, partial [Escherichia coli]|nr:hypothetical protein [Escherichia coli]